MSETEAQLANLIKLLNGGARKKKKKVTPKKKTTTTPKKKVASKKKPKKKSAHKKKKAPKKKTGASTGFLVPPTMKGEEMPIGHPINQYMLQQYADRDVRELTKKLYNL